MEAMKIQYRWSAGSNNELCAEWRVMPADPSEDWCGGYWSTNQFGDGIFWVDVSKNKRSQHVGTCDFSIARCTKATARRRIRRWMEG